MPSHQLPQQPRGPAIWQVQDANELVEAVQLLVNEPLQRRSQGNAAVQATARIANGMLTIAWEVLVIMVLEPALAGVPPRATRANMPSRSAISGQADDDDDDDSNDEDGDDDDDDSNDDGVDDDVHDDADSTGGNSAEMSNQITSSAQAGADDEKSNDEDSADDSPISQGTSFGQAGHGDDSHDGGGADNQLNQSDA